MQRQAESKIYHKVKYRLFFFHLIFNFLVLLTLPISGLSLGMRNFAFSLGSNPWIANGIYIILFSVLMGALNFPVDFFEGFVWEHRFALSTQRFSAWLKDYGKKAVLGLLILLVMVEVVYFILRRDPEYWWIKAGCFYLLVTLVLARITPNVIIPIFFKYSPLKNEELRQRVMALFQKAQVSLKDAYVINLSSKTKKANAFICGLGKSRRVVLSDTLVADFSLPQIETVVAHEIGHLKNKDIVKISILHSLTTFAGFGLIDQIIKRVPPLLGGQPWHDIAFFPVGVLAFSLLGLITTPVLNGYSRMIETKADRFSLNLTRRPEAFIEMIRKLGEMNLSDFEPTRFHELFFYDHPSIAKRIKLAEGFNTMNPPQT